jgi:hypothetical protein
VSGLAYRCDRVQSQQVYFPQDGWRAIGRNAKELNPELRHRLGVKRYRTATSGRTALASAILLPP